MADQTRNAKEILITLTQEQREQIKRVTGHLVTELQVDAVNQLGSATAVSSQHGTSYKFPIILDFPLNERPRYGYGKPPHKRLYEILAERSDVYKSHLSSFVTHKKCFDRIAVRKDNSQSTKPAWINGWFPPLDAMALYTFLFLNKSQKYYEIGSGNSTMFARQAIEDHDMSTKIVSFDPFPRAEIDSICDVVVREPIEDVHPDIFEELTAGDILFVDGSHRVFMNSDATVVFLDILPRLKPGVLVGFHDIFLPFDYPPPWGERHYSEQYLLAAYLLAEGEKFEIVLPTFFARSDPQLLNTVSSLWEDPKMHEVERNGVAFWIRMR
jgi:hypothetical protein